MVSCDRIGRWQKSVALRGLLAALLVLEATAGARPLVLPPLKQATGLPDPTLAVGLTAVADWNGVQPFVDVMKTMRPWIGSSDTTWAAMSNAELRRSGCLDEWGWPRCIPAGLEAIKGVFSWSKPPGALGRDHRAGVYHLLYDGEGALALRNVRVLDAAPGHFVFEVPDFVGNWWLEIAATGDARGANHLRNMRIVREQNLALLEAGVTFAPDWLSLVRDARQLRFMDWSRTNETRLRDWAARPRRPDYTWARGVPFEVQIELANHVGADPWLTIPAGADDAFVAALARLVEGFLDPRLTVWVEFGNEAWNQVFAPSRALVERGRQVLGTDAVGEYYRQRASEVMAIWQAQYTPGDRGRYVRVLGAQTVNLWLTRTLLAGDAWRRVDRQAWRSAGESFDALAVTTYFGARLLKSPAGRELLLRAYRSGDYSAVNERLLDENVEHSIPAIVSRLQDQQDLAEEHGLRLVLYEGGQHVHHWVPSAAEDAQLQAALIEYVRSPEMAVLYRRVWESWQGTGAGPFMQFGEAGFPNKYGSWGLRFSPDDDPPRARLLDGLNAATTNWWGSGVDSRYLHGINARGLNPAETLVGTVEEDYLVGTDADDRLYPGAGDDHVNGLEGEDTLLLKGGCARYRLRGLGGMRFELLGRNESDHLANVEVLALTDGTRVFLTPDLSGELCSLGGA